MMLLIALLCASAHGRLGSEALAPRLRSESVVVQLADSGEVLIAKNPNVVRPIASVTKLLSGLILAASHAGGDELVTIIDDDKDKLKWSKSRLVVGFTAARDALFHAALCASENRAMYAVVRALGFSRQSFAEKMNEQAQGLGMAHSRFVEPTGIDPQNVSTAADLVYLVDAAATNDDVRLKTLDAGLELTSPNHRSLQLTNPDRLARSASWDLVVGKTGYTVEAGRSLVARVMIAGRPVDMIFLGSREMASVFGDASRVRQWLTTKLSAQASLGPITVSTPRD
jgi:D-alanyl-D-alanine endopeptidase (penicillin-binding protein 7)